MVTAWLARRALDLYPLAYRRRYGEEMRALLEDQPPTARTVRDLLRGVLLAHLRPAGAPAGAVDAPDRIRLTASGVLICWVVFAAAGFGFYKATEDHAFSAVGNTHPLLRDAHLAIQALALIASAAVVLGALPLIAAAFAHAREDRGVRRTIVIAFAPLVAFAALTAAVIAIAQTHLASHPTDVGNGLAVVWGIAGLVAGLTCVQACRAALFATPVSPARLRAALAAGTVVTATMLTIAAATALYAVALAVDASQLAGTPTGPFGALSTGASLVLAVLLMVGAGALALTTTVRGWQTQP